MLRFIPSQNENPSKPRPPCGPTLNRWQRREIFREMALAELRYQTVDNFRRKRLVQFAATLNLTATEAGRMLQEAQRELDQEQAEGRNADEPLLTYIPEPISPPVSSWLSIIGGAILVTTALLLKYNVVM